MKTINNQIQTHYKYNDKFYIASERKVFHINDIFIDGRDYGVKVIETEDDLIDVSYMAPEVYMILEEVTVQN
jgi:hypothetical protein